MIKIIELLAVKKPDGSGPRSGKLLRAFRGVTIHDTANTSPTADAMAHANLLLEAWKDRDTSWHYCIDQYQATRSIPEVEVAWHAGDGAAGPGNNETIAIETCINAGGNYNITLQNASELAADILFRHGIKTAVDHLFQHNRWSGKDCPHVIRAQGLWPAFVTWTQTKLTARWTPPQEGEQMLIPDTLYLVTDLEGLVIRSSPGVGTTHPILPAGLQKGNTFVATEVKDTDGYIWAKHAAGWSSIGKSDRSEMYVKAGVDTSILQSQISTLKNQLAAETAAKKVLAAKIKAAIPGVETARNALV